DDLEFYIDSELVVKQINGLYKVKNKDLAEEFLKIYNLRSKFDSVVFHHVYREKNKEADAMVNKALDEKLKKQSN
ncbi:MAG TPA: reverse transcriptase-like protein, partial [Patescibacteria group bacterium]|nr:reverse transcriptase-like protein [Patescibacteria group bacterium]